MGKCVLLLAVIACATLSGCVERRLYIRSDPPGADVYIDGELVGQTRAADHPEGPFYVNFIYYGTREYTMRKLGYATVTGEVQLETPWYEYPPMDFFAEVLTPWPIVDRHEIEVKLERAAPGNVDDLYSKATEYRAGSRPGERYQYGERIRIYEAEAITGSRPVPRGDK
jgi:hypothetical protein